MFERMPGKLTGKAYRKEFFDLRRTSFSEDFDIRVV